jgi:hypothetical protein
MKKERESDEAAARAIHRRIFRMLTPLALLSGKDRLTVRLGHEADVRHVWRLAGAAPVAVFTLLEILFHIVPRRGWLGRSTAGGWRHRRVSCRLARRASRIFRRLYRDRRWQPTKDNRRIGLPQRPRRHEIGLCGGSR